MRKLPKGQGVTPHVIVTDKLCSYDAANAISCPELSIVRIGG